MSGHWLGPLLVPSLTAAALVFGSCGEEEGSAMPPQRTVDVRQGTLDGLGLGDSATLVRSRLGRAAGYSEKDGVLPLGVKELEKVGLPYITAPPRPREKYGDLIAGILRYRGATFQTAPRAGTFVLMITDSRVRTREGVRMGSKLSSAKSKYGYLRCDVRNEGSESPPYPYCTGRSAPGVYVWFGQDPIRSISFATRPMG